MAPDGRPSGGDGVGLAPHAARVDAVEATLRQAEHDASIARIRDRLDRLSL